MISIAPRPKFPLPLVGARGILLIWGTLAHRHTVRREIHLLVSVTVALHTVHHVRGEVLVVSNSEVIGHLGIVEISEVEITNPKPSDSNQFSFYAITQELHCGHLGKGTSQAVTCQLNRVSWVECLKALYLL